MLLFVAGLKVFVFFFFFHAVEEFLGVESMVGWRIRVGDAAVEDTNAVWVPESQYVLVTLGMVCSDVVRSRVSLTREDGSFVREVGF